MSSPGKLYIIPSCISDDARDVLPASALSVVKTLNHFLAEDVRTARRFLSSLKIFSSIEELTFAILNKDTRGDEIESLCQPLLSGTSVGVLSESGCPGIADPGSLAVAFAHRHSIQVVPLIGPSSILLALMASGLNGQKFAFHGYLPVEQSALHRQIKELELESRKRNQTQIFIETPYRNNSVFTGLLKDLSPSTELCVAFDLTGTEESIRTLTIAEWRRSRREFAKRPAVFLFLAK